MIKEETKYQSSTVFEGMTSIRAIIKGIDNGTNDRSILKILYDVERYKKIAKEVGYFKAVSDKYGFELVESNATEIAEYALGSSHGGIIALCEERTIPFLSPDVIRENGFYVMIQGIEDPYNFGYALRSLYACGCTGVILGERNWMSAAGVVCRSSAGASELFEIYRASDEIEAAKLFKDNGYTILSADERTDNTLGTTELKYPLLLIVGGEKRGISRSLLDLCDVLVRIPYSRTFGASLSAASAATMFAYEIMRQNNI